MIRIGDIVRVTAEGQFKGQEVKVLAVHSRKYKIDYHLDTNWDGKPFPGWFDNDEIEKIEAPKKQPN